MDAHFLTIFPSLICHIYYATKINTCSVQNKNSRFNQNYTILSLSLSLYNTLLSTFVDRSRGLREGEEEGAMLI